MAKYLMNGVNVWEAVNGLNGGMDKYLELLQDFLAEGRTKKEQIDRLAQKKDYDSYVKEIHALKVDAMNIGAENLSKEAREHEDAIRDGSYEFVNLKYPQLIMKYERILAEIERVLKKGQNDEK